MRKPSARTRALRATAELQDKSAASAATQAPRTEPQAGTSLRGTVDALVQGALVDLFQAYGVAVAPAPRQPHELGALPEVCVSIGFSFEKSGRRSGRLTLCSPGEVLSLMDSSGGLHRQSDWARELCNQLAGRIKNRLLPFCIRLQTGLPSSVEPKLLREQLKSAKASRSYTGRTLRGEVLVALEGLPLDSELVYAGAPAAPAEGSTLFFD